MLSDSDSIQLQGPWPCLCALIPSPVMVIGALEEAMEGPISTNGVLLAHPALD